MIPKKTTLEERLKFYEFATYELQNDGWSFICFLGAEFFNLQLYEFNISDIKRLFPELYKLKKSEDTTLWTGRQERIEALEKAIIEVKRKIEKQ